VSTYSARVSMTTEAEFSCGSQRVWVYYPQGLLPSHEHFQMGPVPDARLPLFHQCRPEELNPEQRGQEGAAPYRGHSLFQESFFVCRVKDFGDVPHVGDIYVETVVDANCRLGFAKVYPSKNAMIGVDILQDQVLPFYERYAVTIERVFTRSTRAYCGLAPVHPFETLLAASHIEHGSIDPRWGMHNQPCEDFYHVLCKEFFTPAIRNNSYKSFGKLQQDLDIFIENYNHERPCFDHSSQGLTPFAMFSDTIDISTDGKQTPKVSRGGV
jgi:hypothetical protein